MTQTPELPWIAEARKYVGVREIVGKKHSPIVVGFWESIKASFRDDETPWCAGFVGAVLERSGFKSTRSAAARSYNTYGVQLTRPAYGCIVVFWRGSPTGFSGHVGFVVGQDANGNLMVLGGNQGNQVSIIPFSRSRVLSYRWPSIAPAELRYNLPQLQSNGKLSTDEA